MQREPSGCPIPFQYGRSSSRLSIVSPSSSSRTAALLERDGVSTALRRLRGPAVTGAMEAILQHLDQFADVLYVAHSEHVRSWDRETARRAFQWAAYLQHLHGRFQAGGPVRAALERRLRELGRRREPDARALCFQELGGAAELLWGALLRNPALTPAACQHLLAGLREEGGEEAAPGSLRRAARHKTASRLLLSLSWGFGGKAEQPSCFGGKIEAPSCSDMKIETPSCLGEKTQLLSCFGRKMEAPSCLGETNKQPSCSDMRTEASFGDKIKLMPYSDWERRRSSVFGVKTQLPPPSGNKSERPSCFPESLPPSGLKSKSPFCFPVAGHVVPLSDAGMNPVFWFSEGQPRQPLDVPDLLDPVLETQASVLARHLEDRAKDTVGPEKDTLLMAAEVLAQVPKPRVFRLVAMLLAYSNRFAAASFLPKLLLQWLLGDPGRLPCFCRCLDCELLTDLASKYSAFRNAYLDLLTCWGRSMEYDIFSGQWATPSPDVSWEGLCHHFSCLLVVGSYDTRESVACTLKTLKAQDGDFDVHGISVWTDLLQYLTPA